MNCNRNSDSLTTRPLLRWLFIGIVFSLVSAITSPVLADTVYVQAKSATLRAGKTSLDPVVATVKFGDALDVIETEGSWLHVQIDQGATGWIFASKTSPTKPTDGDNDLAQLGQSFRRREASTITASAGARGLDAVSEDYAKRSGVSKEYQQTVDRITAYQITDQDVEDFLKRGQLGEYAR